MRMIMFAAILVVAGTPASAQDFCIPTYCPGPPVYEATQSAQDARAQVIRPQARQHRQRAKQRTQPRRAAARQAVPLQPAPAARPSPVREVPADEPPPPAYQPPADVFPAPAETAPVPGRVRVATVTFRQGDDSPWPEPQMPAAASEARAALYAPPEPPLNSVGEIMAVFIAVAFVISGLFLTLRSMPQQSRERPRFHSPNFGAIRERTRILSRRTILATRGARRAIARRFAERRAEARQNHREPPPDGMPDGGFQRLPVWLGQAKRQDPRRPAGHPEIARAIPDDPFDGGAPLAAFRRSLRAS